MFGLDDQRSRAVDGSPDHRIPYPLGDRHRLSADHGFVDVALPLLDAAIDGDFFSGADPERLPCPDLLERNFALLAVCEHVRRGRGEGQEFANRSAGASAGPQLQHLSQQHEHHDHRRGLKVDGYDARVGLAERSGEEVWNHDRCRAVEIGRPNAQGDQRKHVETAVDETLPAASEKGPAAPSDHRGGEH
jgi:hypothetical protein